MDDDLLDCIRQVAELPTTDETPGAPLDLDLDSLIWQARKIIKREGAQKP